MRHIYLDDGVRLRFPKRSEDFDLGVEVGLIAARMEMAVESFTRRIFAENLHQIRALAGKMGYRLVEEPCGDGSTEILFLHGEAKPSLKLVHSRP
jgi:hypothetical protein